MGKKELRTGVVKMLTIPAGPGIICAVHREQHAPVPLLYVGHHVLPQSWGPSTNTVAVPPTCHMNIHVAIDTALELVGPDGDPAEVHVSKRLWHGLHIGEMTWEYAVQAFALAHEGGFTPAPTL